MRKVIVILLFASFAVLGLASHDTVAYGQEKAAAAPQVTRWHGHIVRLYKDESKMDVRRGDITKTIRFDSSTKWTEGAKVIDMSEFKEGSERGLPRYFRKREQGDDRHTSRPAETLRNEGALPCEKSVPRH